MVGFALLVLICLTAVAAGLVLIDSAMRAKRIWLETTGRIRQPAQPVTTVAGRARPTVLAAG